MLKQKLDTAFRSMCRSILGQELGSLDEFEDYLRLTAEGVTRRVSSVSGKDVYLYYPAYPEKGNFVSDEEREKLPPAKLDINAIKDVDSLREAVNDGFYYCGNKHLGKSYEVEQADGCMDGGFVYQSSAVYSSQYVAYSYAINESKYAFSSAHSTEINTTIKTYQSFRATRTLQSGFIRNCSDMAFCWQMEGCQDCLFSFNQRNRKWMVGNNEFPRDGYMALKKKLLGEVVEVMKKKKTFPTIFEIAKGVRA